MRISGHVCLVAGLIGFVALPSCLRADLILNWSGSDTTNPNSYNDPNNWSCGSGCSGVPNNGGGVAYGASINTLNGSDSVNLDTNPVTINSLVLGGSSQSSTLYTGSNSMTVGSSMSPGNILTIGSSGVLNVQTGGQFAVDTTAATFDGATGFSNAGSINVADGAQLTLRNSSGSGGLFENDGSITLGASTGASLILGSAKTPTTFDLLSVAGGTLNLIGSSTISGASGAESLINDTGHTINVDADGISSGKSSISGLAKFTNNAVINIGVSGAAQAGPISLVIDTTGAAASGFSNGGSGSISVNDGTQLVLKNTNAGPTGLADFNNDGTITLGTSTGAALALNGAGTTFKLTGDGAVAMNGTSSISGQTASESLINDVGHTISNSGTGSISNLAGFTNDGTLKVTSGKLTVAGSANLTNWNAATGTLAGGSYSVSSGTLQLSAIGANTISTLSNASVTVGAGGLLTGDGTTDALSGVTSIQNSSLTLTGGTHALGASGSLTVSSGAVNIGQGTTLSVDLGKGSFNLQGGDLTGGGTLDANLDQTGGTFNPGDPQSFDILGNYNLSAGVLDFDLAGTGAGQYDQVHVGGDVTLNGTLDVTLDDSFVPVVGDVFTDVLDWGAGSIPSELAYFDSALDLNFSLVQDQAAGNEFDLDVSSGSATPEPGTLSMMIGAMLIAGGTIVRARRRRSIP